MKDYYWDAISEEISNVLKNELGTKMDICEIGFASGHFLEWLNENGYKNLAGVEIREDQFRETDNKFKEKEIKVNLINKNILDCNERYDAIYSTGLLQCLDINERELFLKHISSLSSLAILVVPEIVDDRNVKSNEKIGVAGCSEYKTSNLPYELSKYYSTVRCGIIEKREPEIKEKFIYYICKS